MFHSDRKYEFVVKQMILNFPAEIFRREPLEHDSVLEMFVSLIRVRFRGWFHLISNVSKKLTAFATKNVFSVSHEDAVRCAGALVENNVFVTSANIYDIY